MLVRLPLLAILAYLGATIGIFFWGPIRWPITNPGILASYLGLTLTAIVLGYELAAEVRPASSEFRRWRALLLFGIIASCVVLIPSAYVYTGRLPWQVLDVVEDQAAVYRNMLERLEETEGQRGPIIILRALSYPFIFAVIPLAVLNWKQLSLALRFLFAASLLPAVLFSALRGTDREVADLAIVGFAVAMIVMGRASVRRESGRFLVDAGPALAAALVAFVAIALIAFSVFIERKAQRLGFIDEVCVGTAPAVCSDYDHPLLAPTGERTKFAASMLAAYVSQGYFGLSLALEKDHRSTLGVGHSAPLTRLYEMMGGDPSLYEQSYTFRLRSDGWSDQTQWSTMLTWFANDLGFPSTVLLVGILAGLLGLSWRDAVMAENDRAAVVFAFFVQMFLYFPANSQITQTLDAYFAFVCWFAYWLLGRQRLMEN